MLIPRRAGRIALVLLAAPFAGAGLRAQVVGAGARIPVRFPSSVSGRRAKPGARVEVESIAELLAGECVLVPAYASWSGRVIALPHERRGIRFDSVVTAQGPRDLDAILDSLEFQRYDVPALHVMAGETGTIRLLRPFTAPGCGVVRSWGDTAAPVARLPARTFTHAGKPADPVNLVLRGSREQLDRAFRAAGWTPVAGKSLRRIGYAVLSALDDGPDTSDPISNQYVAGRRQDLAFERASPTIRIRHHLRLWQVDSTLWIGAASEDVGLLIWRLKEPTHRIDPRVDRERDEAARELEAGGCASVAGYAVLPGSVNGGRTATGQRFTSDGRALVLQLRSCGPA